ncbi:hypothetical protein C8R44DRAFT_732876 [Mycena epipterygia]|nr:hypothetical protein C8R44DRAFT_732876 [Mycena epipterygia]
MPAKVVILAQFGHGYYIRGTLKRLTDVSALLKAWWICFDHGYYIHGTLKRLTGVSAWLKSWWIRTSNPCYSCLAGEEMPAKVVILAQFGHGYYIRGTLKRLTDVLAWLKAWWICVRVKQVTDQKFMPPLHRWRGNACKAWWTCFGHGYYIHGTLKRLTDVVACLKAWWIRLSVKQATDQKSMPPLPCRRGNAHKSHDFGSVWPRILYPWDFEEADGCFGLPQGLVDPYVVAWLKAWWICKSMPLLPRWGGKVVILAQFGHRYYIRGTLK